MRNKELIQSISNDLAIELPHKITHEELVEKLSAYINHLINHDFQQLVFILYRVDINEAKLKHLLQENPGENAGKIIAHLIIDRQLQKITSRREFKSVKDIPDDEKW
ncbi:MAG: hypothetical protein ACM3H8_09785 [Sphingobacteriales bacterium]